MHCSIELSLTWILGSLKNQWMTWTCCWRDVLTTEKQYLLYYRLHTEESMIFKELWKLYRKPYRNTPDIQKHRSQEAKFTSSNRSGKRLYKTSTKLSICSHRTVLAFWGKVMQWKAWGRWSSHYKLTQWQSKLTKNRRLKDWWNVG